MTTCNSHSDILQDDNLGFATTARTVGNPEAPLKERFLHTSCEIDTHIMLSIFQRVVAHQS